MSNRLLRWSGNTIVIATFTWGLYMLGGLEASMLGVAWVLWTIFDLYTWENTQRPNRNIVVRWRETPFMHDKYGIRVLIVYPDIPPTDGLPGNWKEIFGFNFRNPKPLIDSDFDRYAEFFREKARKECLDVYYTDTDHHG